MQETRGDWAAAALGPTTMRPLNHDLFLHVVFGGKIFFLLPLNNACLFAYLFDLYVFPAHLWIIYQAKNNILTTQALTPKITNNNANL